MHRVLLCFITLLAMTSQVTAQDKPNILVIWGDDIGTWNISHNNRGMMAYRTPNIDRIAREGLSFTDYYGQQSCTAGRAAFLNGSVPVRTGMTKVGMPNAPQGWQKTDVTFATVLKAQGYATGQFGKNHQGDRDEHLPTMHGFDEFLGNLYHLNAEEEPENRDYPGDLELANGKTFGEQFGPRGVIKSRANPDGTQSIEDTGPLTRKRMETIDEETLAAAKDFIQRKQDAGEPWMCWWNATRMHFRVHVKDEHKNLAGPQSNEYADGMVEHDMHVGELLDMLDEMGIAENTIVLYSTDNGVHFNTWPDAGVTPFRKEKASNWEGAYRVPAFVRWPGRFPAGAIVNGIVSHEDWLPTFAAAAGRPNIKDELRRGVLLNGRRYRNYIDGYNMIDYFSNAGTFDTIREDIQASPRNKFIYTTDGGSVAGIRVGDWKAVYLENRAEQLQIWREPFVELRMPLLFNLRRDPYERAQHNSNTYHDWVIDRAFMFGPMQVVATQFLETLQEYPPSQTPGDWSLSTIEEQIEAMNLGGK